MAGLATLAQDLTVWRAAAAKASASLKAWAAANPSNPIAAAALAGAADLDAALNASDLVNVTETVLDEGKNLALAGKGIVQHQSTDTFGG